MNFIRLFGMGNIITYGAMKMPYTFCIAHDKELNTYSASWKNKREAKPRTNFIGDSIHPETSLPHFKTMEAAVEACEQQLNRMGN